MQGYKRPIIVANIAIMKDCEVRRTKLVKAFITSICFESIQPFFTSSVGNIVRIPIAVSILSYHIPEPSKAMKLAKYKWDNGFHWAVYVHLSTKAKYVPIITSAISNAIVGPTV